MFTSYRIIEQVRKAISTPYVTASDTEVARALGISRAAVSAYKNGHDVMSLKTLERAAALAKMERLDIADASLSLSIESARSDGERVIWKTLQDAMRIYRHQLKNGAASILLALTFVAGAFFPGNSSAAASADNPAALDTVYSVKSIMRWLRRLIGTWLPARILAPLAAAALAGCSGLPIDTTDTEARATQIARELACDGLPGRTLVLCEKHGDDDRLPVCVWQPLECEPSSRTAVGR